MCSALVALSLSCPACGALMHKERPDRTGTPSHGSAKRLVEVLRHGDALAQGRAGAGELPAAHPVAQPQPQTPVQQPEPPAAAPVLEHNTNGANRLPSGAGTRDSAGDSGTMQHSVVVGFIWVGGFTLVMASLVLVRSETFDNFKRSSMQRWSSALPWSGRRPVERGGRSVLGASLAQADADGGYASGSSASRSVPPDNANVMSFRAPPSSEEG